MEQILEILQQYSIQLRIVYIPSKLNVIADALSRYMPAFLPCKFVIDYSTLRKVLPDNLVFDIILNVDDFGTSARYLTKNKDILYCTKHTSIPELKNTLLIKKPHNIFLQATNHIAKEMVKEVVQSISLSTDHSTLWLLANHAPAQKWYQ